MGSSGDLTQLPESLRRQGPSKKKILSSLSPLPPVIPVPASAGINSSWDPGLFLRKQENSYLDISRFLPAQAGIHLVAVEKEDYLIPDFLFAVY